MRARTIQPVTRRPYGVQQQWDRHTARMRGRRALRGFIKVCVIPVVVLGLLIFGSSQLAFG